MSVTPVAGGRTPRQLATFAIAIAALLLAAAAADLALAQGAPAPSGGLLGWIIAQQNSFYRQFSTLIRAAKADGSAVWALLAVSFLYGVFHAAGPGHGKAVISSYVVANGETWRRGVILSFASALLQALVAVVFVGIAAALLNATAPTMNAAVNVIEIASYALIVVIGARLLWVKGQAFITALRTLKRPAAAGATTTTGIRTTIITTITTTAIPPLGPRPCAGTGRARRAGRMAARALRDRRGGLAAVLGAILVLVFALAQGLFWAGVAATFVMGLGTAVTVAVIATIAVGARASAKRFADTRSGYGALAMRGIEVAAALAIIAFGALLLAGYMGSERLIGL
jgi:ABC-type nickel/cobalt efflux system permease component RcnA